MEQIELHNPESYRITDLIQDLQQIQAEHGDLAVTYEWQRGGVQFCSFKNTGLAVKHLKRHERGNRVLHYWKPHLCTHLRAQKVLKIG